MQIRSLYSEVAYHTASSFQPNYPPPTAQVGSPYTNFNPNMDRVASQMGSLSVTQTGFDKLWVRLSVPVITNVSINAISYRVMRMLIYYKCGISFRVKESRRHEFAYAKNI